METWYFETSALNKFMEGCSLGDALATKQLQISKGREWRLSPVTLWEILMTADESRREDIIYFCQHLFSRELLPSPAELITSWIEKGMPIQENLGSLISNSALANTWRDLVDDRSKTFVLDYPDLQQKIKMMQSFAKSIDRIIKNEDVVIGSDNVSSDMDLMLSSLFNELRFVKSGEYVSEDERVTYKVSLFYILMILCSEGELENEAIKKFWKKRGINSTLERAYYVVKELPELVHRGPFLIMSLMTIAQTEGKYSRGLWFDSLHSIYLTYADRIFTNDDHFLGLREIISEPMLQSKLHHMKEMTFSHHPRSLFDS